MQHLQVKHQDGNIPNIIDKFITCNVIYLILLPLRNKISKIKQMALILPLGTLISGTTFLTVLMMIAGLPGGMSFEALFIAVVIPTMVSKYNTRNCNI